MRPLVGKKTAIPNFLLAAACMSLITACSDSSSNDKEEETPALNIVETAIDAGNFTTLVAALQAANLDDDLADSNAELTVFAPTDAAFDELKATMSDSEWDALLASDDLASILLYHVADGEILAAQAIEASGDLLPTLNGKPLAVNYSNEVVYVNDAGVSTPNVLASNGVIHVINKVVMPPSSTITDLVVQSDSLSTLETAVIEAGLADALAGEGPFTVFAPTNDAFDKLGADVLDVVLADNTLLNNILTYHVIDQQVSAKTAISLAGQSAAMLNNEDASISLVDGSLYIDRAKVSVTNVLASNGVVHIIDTVMKPEGVDTIAPDGDVVDILAADDNFSTLVTAVSEAGLVSTLQGDGPFTVFAPTNSAFDALPEGTLEALLGNVSDLEPILLHHVFAGEVDAAAAVAADGSALTMVGGSTADVEVMDGSVMIDGATVILTDIVAENGIIHVIDAVITP